MSEPTLRKNRQIGECMVEGCERPPKTKYCSMHDSNLRRHGTLTAPPRGKPAIERFWAKINKTETCWLWTDVPADTGYGKLYVEGKVRLAHRFSYELLVGPIPEGLHLDHLCRVRHCVNPDHLEAVTHAENMARGMSPGAKAVRLNVCKRGHALIGDNVYYVPTTGHRKCRECAKIHSAARPPRDRRKKAA